jgi:hydrogenase maturation protein HypF
MLGQRIEIRGTVQGVGFRPWVYRVAHELGIAGRVGNDAAGVFIDAFGGGDALRRFREALGHAPSPALVRTLAFQDIPAELVDDFVIVPSDAADQRRISIPPDLATCAQCKREVDDPTNRRFDYPFTNCTHCGPRFTIATDVPYDRGATTMADFRLCGECAREYGRHDDRRFHAEPTACPLCGPRLRALDAKGHELIGDPIAEAIATLLQDGIVAVKGVGGFHLACDASSSLAVQKLRARKRRAQKPFAVMVRDLEAARALASLSPEEEKLLASPAAPIVLVTRKPGAMVCPEVAPRTPLLGVVLAYTPLHHLLLRAVDRPLVMTSGNLAEEPIAYRSEDALARLGGIADLFLDHDREIATRCDDSVARVVADAPLVLRRSRGYVPRPVQLLRPVRKPVLAVGGHLKNTFCLAVDDMAVLGPHVGDLDGPECLDALSEAVDRMQRFLAVEPEVIAHDLHPDYVSTRYALSRPGGRKIGVQHHHAHVVSAMAEHQLEGPLIGVAFDGTGYGPDGTAWGSEVLLATSAGFERLATLRPVALAGGELAIRQPWRIALALIDDAFGSEADLAGLRVFEGIPEQDIRVVRQMIARGVNAPLAHGMGRLFDGVGALALGRPASAYEGQIAVEWNLAARAGEPARYGVQLERETDPWILDPREMIRDIVHDLRGGRSVAGISGAFHEAISTATAVVARLAAGSRGRMPVVLTGGCFQNPLLAEKVQALLAPHFDVFLHRDVPPGDGGLALGQAVIADAVSR